IPLLAVTYDEPDNPKLIIPTGYSNVITEFGADPQGDGTVYSPDGRLYYFYSRTRAIGKGNRLRLDVLVEFAWLRRPLIQLSMDQQRLLIADCHGAVQDVQTFKFEDPRIEFEAK
ncbi:hypothetical protein FOZ63_007878, partial [Perkinsus olseni]